MNKKKTEKPILKDRYDWRKGVCRVCGVSAMSGCCERHTRTCPTCMGYGSVTKLIWKREWKRQYRLSQNPPNKCCEECSAYFPHSVGSHSDDVDDTPCRCNENTCDFPNCICHQTKL
jgi:hypothetical protein